MNTLGSFSIGLVVGIACLPASARAQAPAPARPAAGAAAPAKLKALAPARSGQVASPVFVADRAKLSAGAIPADNPELRELSVTAAVATAVIAEPVGREDVRLLDRELTVKFASVDHCRTDVARRKRLAPAHVMVDSLKLRWTIAGQAQVAAMDVVGSTPMDAEMFDCITRDTNGWLFTSPVGGDVRLNRALVFRRLAPASPRPRP